MMTEAEIQEQIKRLEKQKVELLANVNATEGALAALRAVLNPQPARAAGLDGAATGTVSQVS